jgi:hypothetical protein
MSRPFLIRTFAIVALALATVGPAVAQSNPYSPNPHYSPPCAFPGCVPGAALSGRAQLVQASGNLAIQQQQARIEQQRAIQAKIQTQRMAFDEGLYELSNTPSHVQELDSWTQMKVRRVMAQPTESEIVRGDTLNLLLPYVKILIDEGKSSPPVTLSPATLKMIDVTVGPTGPTAGMLTDLGRLSWPLMLRGPTQQQLDGLIPEALQQARAGTLAPSTYAQVVGLVHTMQDELRTKYFRKEIGSDSFLASKDFLNRLESSLSVLERSDAAKFLDGSYAVRGHNVQEVVENMTGSGLQFAPAAPGSESAYFALHTAFVSYVRAAESAGFQSMVAPPQGP